MHLLVSALDHRRCRAVSSSSVADVTPPHSGFAPVVGAKGSILLSPRFHRNRNPHGKLEATARYPWDQEGKVSRKV